MVWPPAGSANSSLTASSNLVSLVLVEPKLPAGVWPFVLSSTHKLPHLTHLRVEYHDPDWSDAAPLSAFGAAGVFSLVGCCANLCAIKGIPLQHGVHVSQLHALTALTFLQHAYGGIGLQAYRESMEGLAAITQLRHLHVVIDSRETTKASLLPLTNLTALTELHCETGLSNCWVALHTSKQAPLAPDVWLQLLECCAADPDCQPSALRSLAQQLAHQRVLTKQQAAQLSEQRALNAQQQQQIAGLQDQLSAQEQVVAEQGMQYRALVAGLEGQLRELRAELQQLRQHRPK